MPLVARVTSSNSPAYSYLPSSIEQWPEQQVLSQWLRGAGFTRVAYRNLTTGIVALHRGRKPSSKGVDPASNATSADLEAVRARDRRARPRRARTAASSLSTSLGPRREALRLAVRAPLRRGRRRRSRRRSKRACSARSRSPTTSPTPRRRYLLAAGGKRVRPTLTLLISQLGDGATPGIVASAAGHRDHAPRVALPRRRHGRGADAPRSAERADRLGQQRRDPRR